MGPPFTHLHAFLGTHVALCLGGHLIALALAQQMPEKVAPVPKGCPGLHAGITAQIIPPYTEEPSVMLSFTLLNDSEGTLDADVGSWRIVINGKELNEMDITNDFRQWPWPQGAWRMLKPGETLQFGAALSIAKYFLPNGQYKVSWRGAASQSPTIVVTITPTSH